MEYVNDWFTIEEVDDDTFAISESYELLVKALSGEAQTPDPVSGQTANIVDFSSAKKELTAVPKSSPIVPKIINA